MENRPTFMLKKAFLAIKVRSKTAADLSAQIVTIIKENGLHLDKCRGQGCDGASVMSGSHKGVQKRI